MPGLGRIATAIDRSKAGPDFRVCWGQINGNSPKREIAFAVAHAGPNSLSDFLNHRVGEATTFNEGRPGAHLHLPGDKSVQFHPCTALGHC